MFEILSGDCLPLLAAMTAASVDAVITDPPYCSGGTTARERTTTDPIKKYQSGDVKHRRYPSFDGDRRDQRSFLAWCTLWLSECYRICRETAPVLVFSDWRQLPVMTDAVQAAGFTWRGIVPWDKTESARPCKGGFRNQAEFIIWGTKGSLRADQDAPYLPGVYRHIVRQADKHHLTGKPTPLMCDLVRVVRPGGVVLDPFSGSGTTGVACALASLDFLGIERDEAYHAIARDRIASAYAQHHSDSQSLEGIGSE